MLPPKVMFVIRPRGLGLRTVAPCSISGNDRSSIYNACPVTFLRPSFRGTDLPMGLSIHGFKMTTALRLRVDLLPTRGDRIHAGVAQFAAADRLRPLHLQ